VAAAPHAYVVEYRAADARPQPGEYVIVGNDRDELIARRGVVLAPHAAFTFTLPPSDRASVLELDGAAADPKGGPFAIAVEVEAEGGRLMTSRLEGTTLPHGLGTDPSELGRESRYFVHHRAPLPSRRGRAITVTIRNEKDVPAGLGAPLVLARVEGRWPRHGIFVFFDAVPHPLLTQLFTQSDDPQSRWLSRWIERGGLFFPEGRSPGQLTGSFVRRFFKADFFRLDGEPSLLGQGFDETPPRTREGPVARLADRGFVTIGAGSNLYLSPVLSRIGFDDLYNLESTLELPAHPPVLVRRFEDEMERHAEDDAFFVVWFANTHIPWREGRKDAPPLRLEGAGTADLDREVLEPIWRNLLESTGALREIHDAAARSSPLADRLWVLGTDHGHTFTKRDRDRPWRLTKETFERGHMHCCLATEQEARTPFVILGENPTAAPGVVGSVQSSMLAWRALERRFDVDLDLPRTSAFAWTDDQGSFDDGVVVSVGNSGALCGRWASWSYRSYQPALGLVPVWAVPPRVASLLAGSPAPDGDVVAEELYDLASDPAEAHNVARARWDDLLVMRSKMSSWMAEYADTPEHPRYRYVFRFADAAARDFSAPRPFLVDKDGSLVESPSRATLTGARIELADAARPLGVVDLAPTGSSDRLLVRCAASGLPLAVIDGASRRLNLAVMRTNCVGEGDTSPPAPGEALFSAVRMVSEGPRAGPSKEAALPELRNALRRWGYVRDK
jgi:hypothetical protein